MESDLHLPLDKVVIGQTVGKLLAHMVAHAAEIERLEVTAMATGMEEYKYGHHLTLEHKVWTVAEAFTGAVQCMFFQFKSKIFTEFIENTEDFY